MNEYDLVKKDVTNELNVMATDASLMFVFFPVFYVSNKNLFQYACFGSLSNITLHAES